MAHLSIANSESEVVIGEELQNERNHVAIWGHGEQLEVESTKPYNVVCSS